MTKMEYIEINKKQKSGGLNINDLCSFKRLLKQREQYYLT